MRTRSRALLLSALFTATAAARATSQETASPGADPSRAAATEAELGLEDVPLSEASERLLELAFESATAIPLQPHVKDRCRAQAAVVETCLELDQPARALELLAHIENWRRGGALADLAEYLAERGDVSASRAILARAEEIAERPLDDTEQVWRTDRIRAKIARVYLRLDRPEEAERLGRNVTDSETGRVAAARASLVEAESFDEELDALTETVDTGSFEEARGGLDACAALFDRFYGDAERRERVERELRSSWKVLPAMELIELQTRLSETATAHGDSKKALGFVAEAREVLDRFEWLPEDRIPMQARLAEARYRAGAPEEAREEVDAAYELFESERRRIYDVFRGAVLRPLAEVYDAMGERDVAASMYFMAVEEGAENPNARPRAEDLCATCLSMARRGFEPDPELWRRMEEIHRALREPW